MLNRRKLNTYVTIIKTVQIEGEDDEGFGDPAIETVTAYEWWDVTQTAPGTESTRDRDTRITQFTAIAPPESVVNALCLVSWEDRFGVQHEATVQGEPNRVTGTRGPKHITVNLQEISDGNVS